MLTVVEYWNKEFQKKEAGEQRAHPAAIFPCRFINKRRGEEDSKGSFRFNPRFAEDKSRILLVSEIKNGKQRIIPPRLFPYRSINRRKNSRGEDPPTVSALDSFRDSR